MANKLSDEIQIEATRVAKAHQKQGQTKEQTKLIAQGIKKGISEYKKQQKIKARERDKQRKQKIKEANKSEEIPLDDESNRTYVSLPDQVTILLSLLVASWGIFAFYFFR
ncbi:MAG: pilus assembly protein TadC [Alteromonadaceae bacterium]|jgi:pilus assembly protein TadC